MSTLIGVINGLNKIEKMPLEILSSQFGSTPNTAFFDVVTASIKFDTCLLSTMFLKCNFQFVTVIMSIIGTFSQHVF
jgi:hypothetical protein